MTPKIILAVVLVVAVLTAWVRLILWRRAGRSAASVWRFVALMILQPICAVLLFFCLFPPSVRVAAGMMVVATAGAPRTSVTTAGAHLIALPEAPGIAGAEPAPDLATALRRYPDIRRIRVIGAGLTERDRDAVRGVDVDFDPPSPPTGLTALSSPRRVAPGAGFQTGGQVASLAGARVDLVDPAGRVTDTQVVDDAGRFVVSGTARAAGPAVFSVRIRDAAGRVVEQADLPVLVEGDAAPRLLIMAGAPGPEVKYLRRWAEDAGFDVTARMSAGGGIELGDTPVAINGATLRRFDVLVIDDRSWAGLGGQRAEVMAAVRGGLGMVLRSGGAADGVTPTQWRSLGFVVAGADRPAPIALPPPDDTEIARTRRGIASAEAGMDLGEDVAPEISRLAVTPGGDGVVPLLRDAGGATLSAWRAVGRGRVAVFTGIDSFGLTLSGRGELYGDWWSTILSTVARPAGGAAPAFEGPAWAGERIALCGLASDSRVEDPNGAVIAVQTGSGQTGCGGFWPTQAGWHLLRRIDPETGEQVWPFFVQPADRLAGVRALRDRQATLMLTGGAQGGQGSATQTRTAPGRSWPWFLGWLILSCLLWGLERSRIGRGGERRVKAPLDPESE